jgi:anhydro-N-acetylmuramic acid kinase
MTPPTPRRLIVAGVMSGTSADGVDVAICRISPSPSTNDLSSRANPERSEGAAEGPATRPVAALRSVRFGHEAAPPKLKLLAHQSFPYPRNLRLAILSAMDAKQISAAELAHLSWRLGEVYADAIAATSAAHNLQPQLAVIHGQTIYHQATLANYLGKPLRCTWQIGEPAIIAERLHLPVVSDLRPADLAAGGQGAPLVPMLDFCLYRHPTRNRLLLNLGGIANITALPAACTTADVLAFDTGPASMVIDALTQRLYTRRYDQNGSIAARGQVLKPLLDRLLTDPYYAAPPPKSCGREEYGAAFTDRFLTLCKSATNEDIIATATAFTVATILDGYRRFCWPHLGQRAPLARATGLFAAGGGANNQTLMRSLTEAFAPLGVKVSTTASNGLPVEAKEAAAFALLGWLTWHHLPGNIPSATGAAHPAILGRVTFA